MTSHPKLLIIGGGIAGLSAAYFAKQQGLNPLIFEASSKPGGLLSGFSIDGFQFDQAVHLSFAEEHEVRDVFDQASFLRHVPESLNWDDTQWLRHPVQNNMYPLPVNDKVELIEGLINRPSGNIENYKDWLLHQYGQPIYNRWPARYTKKYWRLAPDEMGIDWVGSRVRPADIAEVLRGAMEESKDNHFYTAEMRYPNKGGYFSFIKPLIDESVIRYNHKLETLDLQNKRIYFDNGRTETYDYLVSTIPLPLLVKMTTSAPTQLQDDANSLFATSVDLISVGFNLPRVSPSLWFYIYDETIEAARAYSPSWKSSNNAPTGMSSLQFEIYSRPGEKVDRSVDYLMENTRMAISKLGLAKPEDILFMHHHRMPYGNVVFPIGMEIRRDRVRNWLYENGIRLAGRFGLWEYLWSNQAFMSGKQAIDTLKISS